MRDRLFPHANPVRGRFVRRGASSLEILEERIAPAVTASFSSTNGSLQVTLGANKDAATVTSTGSGAITVTGTGGLNASFTGVVAVVVNFDQTGQTVTTVDSVAAFGNHLTSGFLLNGNGVTSNGFTLIDSTGGNAFTLTDAVGKTSLTNNGTVADTLNVSKSASFTLTNTALTDSADTMSVTLKNVGAANLTDTGAAHTFTVSGWTGHGSLTGGATDAVLASKVGGFALSNALLTDTADAMSLGLSGIEKAYLTDASSSGGDAFTVGGWTGTGTLTNHTGVDTVAATKSASYTLTSSFVSSSDGMLLRFAVVGSIGIANLTDTGGGHTFTVSGWGANGTLMNTGLTGDTVTAVKSASFDLTNASLSGGLNLTLATGAPGDLASPFSTANLTNTAGPNSFTVSGWTGGGTLTNDSTSENTVIAAKSASFTLTNASLSSSDGMSLALAGDLAFPFGNANLTDSGGNNSFTVSGWSSGGVLAGPSTDTVIASKAGGFTLKNTSVTDTADAMSLTLATIGEAELTDTVGSQSFMVSGWTGGGTLTNSGGNADAVIASKSASYTLTNIGLSASDGMSLVLLGSGGFGTANLTDTGGSHSFTVSGWTGGATLTNTGGVTDAIVATKSASYTLTNVSLESSDGMSLALTGVGGFGIANLTDQGGSQSFTVSAWTGNGTLTNTGGIADAVIATKSASYTLTSGALSSSDGMSLTLAGTGGFGTANLSDTGGSQIFTVSGWMGNGTLTGPLSDTVAASKAGGFTLTGASLADTADGMRLGLSGISLADLTDTSGGQTFSISDWTGGGVLTNDGVPDTVIVTKSASFTLANQSLRASDGMSFSLEGGGISVGLGGFNAADLIDTGGDQSFTVSGWTGGGMLLNDGGAADTVIATKSASFTLSNNALASSDGMALTLSGSGAIAAANLTDTGGDHSFTVSGWTHKGALTGGAGDAVVAAKNVGSFLLTDHSLATTDGMALILTDVTAADLSVATPTFGSVIFNAIDYSGALTATGGAPIPKAAGLKPLGNVFYGGSGSNTLIGGTDQDHYILQGLATESDTLVEPAADSFFTFNGYNEIGNAIDFSHMTTPTETVGGVKIGVDVNLNDISLAGVTQVFDPAITNANPTKGQPGTLTLIGHPGSFDELAGSPFKDTLTGNDSASPQFASQAATIKTLNNLLTLIYTGGDATAEDSIVTGHGGAYLIYGKYGTLTEAVPGVVFRLPDAVPYFAMEPSGLPSATIDAKHPLTYRDIFGNIIKITLRGPGSIAASYDSLTNDPDSLTLTGTTPKSALSVQFVGTLGEATVGRITDSSGIGSIDLGLGVSLGDGTGGGLSVAGPVGSLTLGGVNPDSILTATSFGNIVSTSEIQAGSSIETSVQSGAIGNITVKLTNASGVVFAIEDMTVQAASIGNIDASVSGAPKGLTTAAAIDSSTFTATAGNIGAITGNVMGVTGSSEILTPAVTGLVKFVEGAEGIVDSHFSAAGNIGSITATSSGVPEAAANLQVPGAGVVLNSFLSLAAIENSDFSAEENIGAIHVADAAKTPRSLPGSIGLAGIATSQFLAGGNIGAVQVSESVTGAPKTFVPGTNGIDASLIQAGGAIARISVAHDVTDTNIFAGADLGKTIVKTPTANAGLSAISIGSITITGSLTSDTPGEDAIAATGDIGAVSIGGGMSGYAIAAGFDGAADAANSNGRIASVIVNGQFAGSSIVAGVESNTELSSATPYTWGSLSDNQGVSLAGVTQTSRIGAIILGATTVPGSVTSSVTPDAMLAHDGAIEAMALVSIKIGKLKADSSFATDGYIQESAGAEAAGDTLVRAGLLS